MMMALFMKKMASTKKIIFKHKSAKTLAQLFKIEKGHQDFDNENQPGN